MSLGCPDDAPELMVMRFFCDNCLKSQPNGEAEIQKYYEIVPQIVAIINEKSNSGRIYRDIYAKYIQPCVSFIEQGNNETVYYLYSSMVDELSKRYLKKTN